MSKDGTWPPKSPHAALLSSPSGRKKYAENTLDRSPMKRSATTPGLLERLRAARANQDILPEQSAEDEEDEETLQLQLAAIEAKLKLKKLQQSKAKVEADDLTSKRPSSAAPPANSYTRGSQPASGSTDQVQVNLSPTRKTIPAVEPRSPGRVLLGIDKGLKASEISLRRAKSTTSQISISQRDPSSKQGSTYSWPDASTAKDGALRAAAPGSKSFSERMASVRDGDRSRERKKDALGGERTAGFRLNAAEVESYRSAAESNGVRARSPVKPYGRPGYSREDVLLAKTVGETGSKGLKKSSTMASLRQSPSRPTSRGEGGAGGDSSLYEGFSSIDLSTRILPHSFLKRTLPEDEYKIYTIEDLLRDVKSPDYELPDEVGNYVVFGIIAAKSSPRDHKQKAEEASVGSTDWERKWENGQNNTRKFIVMTLTDLNWSCDLFLFSTAVPRYHRLTPGTVVAILNPAIMPPKKGKEDTGAFSLTLHNGEDTVLEIGTARNLGYCSSVRKDGKECGQWINAAKTEVCEFHLNMQLYKTQSQRMGINGGNTSFGGNGSGPRNPNKIFDSRTKGIREGEGKVHGRRGGAQGKQYNQYTGAYYVSGAAPVALKAPGTAVSYMADPQESRDKKSLLKKRMATQAQEAEIAHQIGAFSDGRQGSEYLRQRKDASSNSQRSRKGGPETESVSQRSALSAKSQVMGSKSDASARNGNGKRAADSVRLSPMKKTRFLTDKGIREAGRESFGVTTGVDDDDLDIV